MLAAAVALALVTDPSVQLATLASRYRDYELPLPPKDAKLYRLTWHRRDNPPGRQEWVEVGFPLAVNPLGKPEKALVGLNEERWYIGDGFSEAELAATNWNGLTSRGRWSEWLVAIQCAASGRHELALAAWHAFTKSGGNPADVRTFLAKEGWEWWVRRFQHHNADRAKVARRLQMIVADYPDATNTELLRKLKLSLQPTDAKSGTLEARIDELLDVALVLGPLEDEQDDPRLDTIIRLGFDAVPALIDHLGDDRLTRSRMHGGSLQWEVFTPHPYSVKHVARDLLYGFMAYPNTSDDRKKNKILSKEDVLEWWAEAKKEGEETYVIRQVVKHSNNEYLLTILSHKYPKRLPEVFGAVAKEVPLWIDLRPLVGALVRSSVDAATKTKVLLEASKSSDVQWQAATLAGLNQIDRDEFHKRLIASLSDLPTEAYRAKEREFLPDFYTCIVNVAMLTDDAKVWAAVGKYLESASPEVKVEWVHHLTSWTESKDKCYRRVIGCVAALLNDESLRLEKNGDRFSVISVRNDTAEHLGRMLFVKTTPNDQWADEDWREFREEVAKAAKKVTESKK